MGEEGREEKKGKGKKPLKQASGKPCASLVLFPAVCWEFSQEGKS